MSPLPVSPLSQCSPNFEGDMLDAPTSPLPLEPVTFFVSCYGQPLILALGRNDAVAYAPHP